MRGVWQEMKNLELLSEYSYKYEKNDCQNVWLSTIMLVSLCQ